MSLSCSRMRSECFLLLSGGLGGEIVFESFLARVRRASASVRGVFAWAWLSGGATQRVSSMPPRACVWTFRVAGVGNGG